MNKDPKLVIESITDNEVEVGESKIAVYPISIRRYALLEILNSPFLNPEVKFEINSVIPTAYVFTHTNDQLKKFNSNNKDVLEAVAYDWADANLKLGDISQLIAEIVNQMNKLNEAAPDSANDVQVDQSSGDNKKKS